MKPALQALWCGVGITLQSKCLHGAGKGLLGAFLRWRYSRKVRKELESFFRTAEAMGLDPMKEGLPPFLAAKVLRAQAIITTLTGINFPLKAATEQQQP